MRGRTVNRGAGSLRSGPTRVLRQVSAAVGLTSLWTPNEGPVVDEQAPIARLKDPAGLAPGGSRTSLARNLSEPRIGVNAPGINDETGDSQRLTLTPIYGTFPLVFDNLLRAPAKISTV